MNKAQMWERKICCLLLGRQGASAAQELARQMEKFEGLYEPGYRFVHEKSDLPSPLKEWVTRARRISPDGPLAAWLKALSEKKCLQGKDKWQVRWLLCLIRAAGIYRESYKGQALVITSRQVRAYIALDGHEIHLNETVQVLKAAWYLDGRVAEHGLVGELP